MRYAAVMLGMAVSVAAAGQAPGKWPPDSLLNTLVIPRTTSTTAVWGQMRNFASALGVECTYCHVGTDGAALPDIDFAADAKATKRVAREMMRLVAEVNRRLDTLPQRGTPPVAVSCFTCHRGVSRPIPLGALIADVAIAAGADSAIRAYQGLRRRYYGRDAYDFGDVSLNTAAFRTARAGRITDALSILSFNEGLFPQSSSLSVTRGNVLLMRGDTVQAAEAFRQALRKDPSNDEARGRLRDVGRPPPAARR